MTDDEIDTIWWMAGKMKPWEFRKYMRVVFAGIADTVGASEELEKCAGCTARCTNDPPDCYASGGQNADTAGAKPMVYDAATNAHQYAFASYPAKSVDLGQSEQGWSVPATPASIADKTVAVVTVPPFEDERVQLVYGLICDTEVVPPAGEHWDGFVSRRIVAALELHAKLSNASSADTAGAKLSASNLPEEFRIKDPADYKRTMDTQFAATPAPSVADAAGANQEIKVAYQEGHFQGHHDGMKAAEDQQNHEAACWRYAVEKGFIKQTEQEWIVTECLNAAPPAPSVADAAGAEKDAKRWRYAYKHLIIGTQDTRNGFEEIGIEAIDAAIAKESGNDLE